MEKDTMKRKENLISLVKNFNKFETDDHFDSLVFIAQYFDLMPRNYDFYLKDPKNFCIYDGNLCRDMINLLREGILTRFYPGGLYVSKNLVVGKKEPSLSFLANSKEEIINNLSKILLTSRNCAIYPDSKYIKKKLGTLFKMSDRGYRESIRLFYKLEQLVKEKKREGID